MSYSGAAGLGGAGAGGHAPVAGPATGVLRVAVRRAEPAPAGANCPPHPGSPAAGAGRQRGRRGPQRSTTQPAVPPGGPGPGALHQHRRAAEHRVRGRAGAVRGRGAGPAAGAHPPGPLQRTAQTRPREPVPGAVRGGAGAGGRGVPAGPAGRHGVRSPLGAAPDREPQRRRDGHPGHHRPRPDRQGVHRRLRPDGSMRNRRSRPRAGSDGKARPPAIRFQRLSRRSSFDSWRPKRWAIMCSRQ